MPPEIASWLKAWSEATEVMPAVMDSRPARIMLVAIGLQESRLIYRKQIGGPAKGLAQFELGGGVHGVMTHRSTELTARTLCDYCGVPFTERAAYDALEHDDVLAAGFARLLLWSDPFALPNCEDSTFELYLRTWRPGAWTRGTLKKRADLRTRWGRNYRMAVDVTP